MSKAAVWAGVPSIKGNTEPQKMVLLTFCLIGLQFTWGIEMTYCTPYLLELGLTKSRTSLVWIAGPLSGMIMAPMVGAIADKSKSRWGRRRPFMVGGAVIVAACLFVLGWSREIVDCFMGPKAGKGTASIVLAVMSIYALDFAINAASRMVAVGHLVVYGAGALDLETILGPTTFGETQFKKLIVIAAFTLLFTVGVTCWAVTERIRISDGDDVRKDGGLAILKEIFTTARHMPHRIQAICWVQFWAWIGWFPFLFYSSTWVGEVYFRYHPESVHSKDVVGEIGRIGSTALIVFSLVTFTASVALPFFVQAPDDDTTQNFRAPSSLRPIAEEVQTRKPALISAWFWSHFIFVGAMGLAPFVSSVRYASILVAVSGLPWALASWAPYTFMGVEINRLGGTSRPKGGITRRNSNNLFELVEAGSDSEASSADDGLSGIYLGILNLFTTMPQFIGTFISMIVFTILEPGSAEVGAEKVKKEGVNGIAVCLFIGALCAVVAAYATRRLQRML